MVARSLGRSRAALDLTAGDGSFLVGFDAGSRYGVDPAPPARGPATVGYRAIAADPCALWPLLRSARLRPPVVLLRPPGASWEADGLGRASAARLGHLMARGLLRERGHGAEAMPLARFERDVYPEFRDHFYAVVTVVDWASGAPPWVLAFFCKGRRADKAPVARLDGARLRDFLDTRIEREVAAAAARCFPQAAGSGRADGDAAVDQMPDGSERRRRPIGEKARAVEEEWARRHGGAAARPTIALAGRALAVSPSSFTRIVLEEEGDGSRLRWLLSLGGKLPAHMAQRPREWRALLALEERAGVTFSPEARGAISRAVDEAERRRVPLRPVPERMRIGFLVDEETVECVSTDEARGFIAGQRYPVACTQGVAREKAERVRNTQEGPQTVPVVVERGALRIRIGIHWFHERPADIAYLLSHFRMPDPGDLASRRPEEVAYWEGILDRVEAEIRQRDPSFSLKWFQRLDMARILCKGRGKIAHEQGLGKALESLVFSRALEMAGRVPDGCALFVMPQDLVPQFAGEAMRFFGRDLLRISHLGAEASKARPRRVGEVSAIQAREMVRRRRAWVSAQAGGSGRDPGPEPPAAWFATWYEALSITQRVSERSPDVPVVTVAREAAPAAAAVEGLDPSGRPISMRAREARVERAVLTSQEVCPLCQSDREHGWDGEVCRAAVGNNRRALRASGHFRRRGTCGYVHRDVLRKPAYSVLGDVFRTIVVDEATMIKGDDSLFSLAVRGLRARYRAVATGTPMKERSEDLFWLLWWVNGDGAATFPYQAKKAGPDLPSGKAVFASEFGVTETALDPERGAAWRPESGEDPPYAKRAKPKVMPGVGNPFLLWRLLAPSMARRRMEDVGAVVALDGAWRCGRCGREDRADVGPPGGPWRKPAAVRCGGCSTVWDTIVPLTFRRVPVPWGRAQKALFAAWLDPAVFAQHFALKHPRHPLVVARQFDRIASMAAALGQFAKLIWTGTSPADDPDLGRPEILPPAVRAAIASGISPWTPARAEILRVVERCARGGEKVLVGSTLVAPGPWISERLRERGVTAVRIADEEADGRFATRAPRERAEAVRRFRAGLADAICVGMNAVALGHNLDVASVVVCLDPPWSFTTWDQFIKRARRLTSQRPVTVYLPWPEGSLADMIWDRVGLKTASSNLGLDGEVFEQEEEPIDQAEILRELRRRGVRMDGTEADEAEIERAWRREAAAIG